MCRWIAYHGNPIYLEELILKPKHSLIDQSLEATHSETTTNGDGFGIGWYGSRETPGVYKDLRPAWNDPNLRAIASQIQSPLFFAHIRAATGTAVQRSNCHPFQYGRWLFVHNGMVRDLPRLKRDLALAVAPELYSEIQGTTDSELMFFLALTFGMTEDVRLGVARMCGFVGAVGERHGVEHPLQMSLGISDGEKLYAFRYSSEHHSRSLFYTRSVAAIAEITPDSVPLAETARAVVSEPLTGLTEHWQAIPESSYVVVDRNGVTCEEFTPQMPGAGFGLWAI